ncbi:MAG: oligosaccharide flippase family protein [Rikenellaceae bacterium]
MAINQLKAGAALSYLIIIFNILIGVLYTPYMLRELGQAEYGLYSLAASLIAYLTLLDLGFGNAIIRYTAKFRAEGREQEQGEMYGMFLKLYVAIGAVALLIGVALMANVGTMFGETMNTTEMQRMRIIIALMSLNLAFTFPLSIFGSIITAYENFLFQRVVSLIRMLLNPAVMVLLLFLGYKAIALVVVTTLFNLGSLMVNWWYCRKRLKVKIRHGKFRWLFFREIFVYSFWIFLNAIMDRIYWSSGQFILGIYKGTVAVAIYAVAIQLQQLYMLFSTAISGVFLPKVTAIASRGEEVERELSDLFIRTGRIQYSVMAFILSGFILLGRPFITLWAGEDYTQAYTITLLFFIPLTVPLIQNLGITILQAQNRMKFRSVLYVSIALASLILSILLAPKYGGVGCAIATAAALVVGQIVVMNIYYHRRIRIDILRFWREIGGMSLVPLLLLALGWYLGSFYEISSIGQFVVAAAIFSILYLPLFYRFSLNSYERGLLGDVTRKILMRFRG